MKITKTKSGSYRTVICVGLDTASGKRLFKTLTGKTKRDVIRKAQNTYQEYDGITVSSDSFYNAAVNFSETRKPVASPNTYRDYKSRLRTLQAVSPGFCAKSVMSITTADVQAVLNNMLSPHEAVYRKGRERKPTKHIMRACAPKTIANYWGFINSVLKDAGRFVRPPQLPQKVRPHLLVPTDADMKMILSAADRDLSICIRLGAYGPMREGEICALSLDDIRGNVVHVSKDIAYYDGGGYGVKDIPKTEVSDRFIEFPANLINEIRSQGYVTQYNPKTLRYQYRKLLDQLQLPPFRFHDLRHYGASIMHAKKIPDAYIMKRGGWSTDSTLKNVYRHTLADQEAEFTNIALSHFSDIETPISEKQQ